MKPLVYGVLMALILYLMTMVDTSALFMEKDVLGLCGGLGDDVEYVMTQGSCRDVGGVFYHVR